MLGLHVRFHFRLGCSHLCEFWAHARRGDRRQQAAFWLLERRFIVWEHHALFVGAYSRTQNRVVSKQTKYFLGEGVGQILLCRVW